MIPESLVASSKPLVLIVEDEAALMTMLRYNLEKQGFRVEEAGDGEEALTRISELKPDLVLLDWMLPHLSGIEVCRQIRRRPAMRELPVIMISARGEDQDTVRGLNHRRRRLCDEALQHRGAGGPDAGAHAPLQYGAGQRRVCASTTSCWTSRRTASAATAARCISARPNTG